MKQITKSEQVNKPSSLSARWTHAEHTGILVDRLGNADISGWSRGTTQAHRPEVGKVERKSNPVKRLASVKPVEVRQVDESKPDAILIGQNITDNGSAIMAKRSERIVPITNRFSAHYERSVARVGHEMSDTKPYLSDVSEEDKVKTLDALRGRDFPRG